MQLRKFFVLTTPAVLLIAGPIFPRLKLLSLLKSEKIGLQCSTSATFVVRVSTIARALRTQWSKQHQDAQVM